MGNKIWGRENILAGLKRFYQENNRYPTAHEIDSYKHLPSSRQIQRAFGGLVNLRKELGLNIVNYGVGASRSKIAYAVNKRGANLERQIEKILIDRFGEHFVHIEKPIYKYYSAEESKKYKNKTRADFFIYAKNYQFCVDVFYTNNYRNLINIINIKQSNYSHLNTDVYLINLNENSDISEEKISSFMKNKKKVLDANIKIMNRTQFINFINTLERLEIR